MASSYFQQFTLFDDSLAFCRATNGKLHTTVSVLRYRHRRINASSAMTLHCVAPADARPLSTVEVDTQVNGSLLPFLSRLFMVITCFFVLAGTDECVVLI